MFKNENGKLYKIISISKSKDYVFLVEDELKAVCPYIIAWLCNEESHTWAQGHYYRTIEDAFKDWQDLYQDE